MYTRLACALLLIAAMGSVHATPRVQVLLRPDSILPGTSSDVIVSMQNDTSEPLRVSPFIKFNVVDPFGHRFVASGDHTTSVSDLKGVPEVFLRGESYVAVPPESRVTISIPFFWPSSPFRDARFTTPGRYEITATMEAESGASLTAEPVALFVTAPNGKDAEVWQHIQEKCGAGCAWGHWQSFGLRQTVLAEYPESRYASYAAGYDFRESDASRLRAIALAGPYRDHVLLFEADTVAGERLIEAILNRDHAGALRAAAEKRELLERIIRTTLDPYVRAAGLAAIDEIPSSSALAENIRELATPKSSPTCSAGSRDRNQID